jgi:hypothetical protein
MKNNEAERQVIQRKVRRRESLRTAITSLGWLARSLDQFLTPGLECTGYDEFYDHKSSFLAIQREIYGVDDPLELRMDFADAIETLAHATSSLVEADGQEVYAQFLSQANKQKKIGRARKRATQVPTSIEEVMKPKVAKVQ